LRVSPSFSWVIKISLMGASYWVIYEKKKSRI